MALRPEELVLPFSALVGQEHVQRALLMLAVNPRLHGLLIRGEKGTGKSTAARGLAALLPRVRVNAGCAFRCAADRPRSWCDECSAGDPPGVEEVRPSFVTLPLGATEDQVLGTFDLSRALQQGERRFAPGLLARANQGVLYVDEVNLLEDHLVDVLLDAAALGVHVVAREGLTLAHPAAFLLVGTMNPEEGDLRPQLTDRFGLCAEIKTLEDLAQRARIAERSLAHESEPATYREKWADEERGLGERILQARARLEQVQGIEQWLEPVARLSVSLGVHGHRADALMIKAVATLAALDGRTEIQPLDLEQAAELVYPHRLRRQPFEETAFDPEMLRERVRDVLGGSTTLEKKSPKAG